MFVNMSAIISCELWKNSFSKCQLLSDSLVVFRLYNSHRPHRRRGRHHHRCYERLRHSQTQRSECTKRWRSIAEAHAPAVLVLIIGMD